jgi:endoglucanase
LNSQNSDVFKGVLTWGAGGFATSYVISNTPFGSGKSLTNQPLVTDCLIGKFKNPTGVM